MAAAKPWMKFYPRDWRADEKLRDCSLAARGLWIEMLALMHASDKYGRLLVAGKAPTISRLAVQVGASEAEVETLMAELREADVFSVDAGGIIYSRRMKSDEKIAENARRNGKRGGNPKLCKDEENRDADKGLDKQEGKASLKPRGQRPDKKPIGKKEIPLPDDWTPSPFAEGTQSRSIVDSWPEGPARQVERFKAHHLSRGSTFKDWQQAWSTWVLNSREFERGRAPIDSSGSAYLASLAERTRLDEISQASAGG